jgi:hypothetical protein
VTFVMHTLASSASYRALEIPERPPTSLQIIMPASVATAGWMPIANGESSTAAKARGGAWQALGESESCHRLAKYLQG